MNVNSNYSGIPKKKSFYPIILLLLGVALFAAPVFALPNLTITAVTFNPGAGGELFANEPNIITATIKNTGDEAATPFDVKLVSGSYNEIKRRSSNLAAGSQTTLTFTGYAPSTTGDVTLTVTADSSSEVTESNEGDNSIQPTRTVYYNGYKGKRWTAGSDIETQVTFEGQNGIVYSAGNGVYKAGGWSATTQTWTAEQLPIPTQGTIIQVRLYQAYTWDQTLGGYPLWTLEFNGATVTPFGLYTDSKSYGGYDYPQGLYVYDVTSQFLSTGNTMTITPHSGNNNGIYGAYIVVVYQDPSTTEKLIYINDGMDILASSSSYSVNNTEATAYATFTGIDTCDLENAQVVAILSSANDAGKSKFFFNNNEYTGFWSGYLSSPQIGFSIYDVTGAITSGSNAARFQSYDSGSGGDNMYAHNAILIVEKQEAVPAPVAAFTADPTSGTAPLTVSFTDQSTNSPTSWTWEYRSGAGDWTEFSIEQSPEYSFSTAGNYDIMLTATNTGGSDDETKTGYITVNEPVGPPVAAFTADPTSGTVPLVVQFSDESTGEISIYAWDFDNDGTTDSSDQNPDHIYSSSGTYTVKLTVSGPGGSDEEIKTGFITVNDESSIEVSVSPPGVSFGAMSAAAPSTASTTVSVTTTGTGSWSVTASDQKSSHKGYMTTLADLALEHPLELSNDGSAWNELSSDFSDFITGSGAGTATETAGMRQAVYAGDLPGDYSITITFTGAMS